MNDSATDQGSQSPTRTKDRKVAFALEVMFFALVPWLVVFACTLAYWPSIYYTLPVLFPLSTYPYHFGMSRPTIFHHDRHGLIADILYSAIIGVATVYVANRLRKPSPRKVAAVYVATAGIAALVSHALAFLFSLEFFMETP